MFNSKLYQIHSLGGEERIGGVDFGGSRTDNPSPLTGRGGSTLGLAALMDVD